MSSRLFILNGPSSAMPLGLLLLVAACASTSKPAPTTDPTAAGERAVQPARRTRSGACAEPCRAAAAPAPPPTPAPAPAPCRPPRPHLPLARPPPGRGRRRRTRPWQPPPPPTPPPAVMPAPVTPIVSATAAEPRSARRTGAPAAGTRRRPRGISAGLDDPAARRSSSASPTPTSRSPASTPSRATTTASRSATSRIPRSRRRC